MIIELKLKIHQIEKEETRRGWVRIEENTRGDIDSGTLILLQSNNTQIVRNVLGVPIGYLGVQDPSGKIFMDEIARKELGFVGNNYRNNPQDFKITALDSTIKWLRHAPNFYWNHPDFPTNFASKIAIISLLMGLFSLLLGLVSLVGTFLPIICRS